MSTHRQISRRTWLKEMAVFSAAAGMPLMVASTAAEAKASKSGRALPRPTQGHARVPLVQVLHFGWRQSLRDDGRRNDGTWHDGRRNDGSRSVPGSRRQN